MAHLISAQQGIWLFGSSKAKNYFPLSFLPELQTKKILEDLQLKKKLLLSTNSNNSMPQYNQQVVVATANPEKDIVNNSSRTALQQAEKVSFCYFVSQNSSFGNLILPVLPSFETSPTQPPATTK